MNKLSMKYLKLLVDESIADKLFSLIPQDELFDKNIIEKLDAMSEDDRQWILHVFEKVELQNKRKQRIFFVNKLIDIGMYLLLILFLLYGFAERNNQHDSSYYVTTLVIFLGMVLLYFIKKCIRKKFLDKKLKMEDL